MRARTRLVRGNSDVDVAFKRRIVVTGLYSRLYLYTANTVAPWRQGLAPGQRPGIGMPVQARGARHWNAAPASLCCHVARKARLGIASGCASDASNTSPEGSAGSALCGGKGPTSRPCWKAQLAALISYLLVARETPVYRKHDGPVRNRLGMALSN